MTKDFLPPLVRREGGALGRYVNCAYTHADGKSLRHLLIPEFAPNTAYCGLNPRPHYWENQNHEFADDSYWIRQYCKDCLMASAIPQP